MPDIAAIVESMLDVVASADSDRVRVCARRRLRALRAAELERVGRRRLARSEMSPIDRFRARAEDLGPMRRLAEPCRPDAVALARRLLGATVAEIESVALDLGRAELGALCRDLDASTAARIARRIGPDRASMTRIAGLLPRYDEEATRRSCRRLALLTTSGSELARDLGMLLLATLLAAAEPQCEAAIRRRSSLPRVNGEVFDAHWIDIARAIVEREVRPWHG